MTKQLIIVLSFVLAFVFVSCGANQSAKDGENWLNRTRSKKAKVDVTGKWKHGSGEYRGGVWGWGGSSGFGTIVLE
ncbi:MAG: hypothetical protein IEMM0008_1148 [bacterium]|nr:MAG: hypothetical protein IEMM0008_1148 [bacterium]